MLVKVRLFALFCFFFPIHLWLVVDAPLFLVLNRRYFCDFHLWRWAAVDPWSGSAWTYCVLCESRHEYPTLSQGRLLILGHGDRWVKKSSFRRSGLRVRVPILVPRTIMDCPLLTGEPLFPHMCSASHLATVQAVIYDLLRLYRHDGYLHNGRCAVWVANPRLELGIDYPSLTCEVGCHILVLDVLLFFFFCFFFGSEKCVYSVFAFYFADRAELVVDDFFVLRCHLHAWALVWGTCLTIRIFPWCRDG